MATDRMTHDWQPYPGSTKWLYIPGKPDCLLKLDRTPKGYLWQHGKQFGYGETLAQAKEWAETAREFWPRKL